MQRSSWMPVVGLSLFCLVLFYSTNYGGARSPDEETVFHVGQSLATGRGFEMHSDIEGAPGFGWAVGTDGKRYSVYPPTPSLVLATFILAAEPINDTKWYEGRVLPLSYCIDHGFGRRVRGMAAGDPRAHALRYVVSVFNLAISLIGVLVFWLVARRVTRSETAAVMVAALYAFGSLVWPYSGTMFGEPLATLFVMLSLLGLIRLDPKFASNEPGARVLRLFLSGLCLGIGSSVHPTAVLFAPFFLGYAIYLARARGSWRTVITPSAVWGLGLAVILVLIGIFNHARFGDVFESGRSLSPCNLIQFNPPWSAPFWRGLYGLVAGGSKGILVFCPAVILAAIGWPALFRRHRPLAILLIAAAVFRLLFVAAYGDWHGGYCTGPRYLYMVIPFLLLPFGLWVEDRLETRRFVPLCFAAGAGWLCVAQQYFLSLGDVFAYYHLVKYAFMEHGVNIFANDRLYVDWSLSPFFNLLDYPHGAYALRNVPLSHPSLWITGSLVLLVPIAAGMVWLRLRRFADRTGM